MVLIKTSTGTNVTVQKPKCKYTSTSTLKSNIAYHGGSLVTLRANHIWSEYKSWRTPWDQNLPLGNKEDNKISGQVIYLSFICQINYRSFSHTSKKYRWGQLALMVNTTDGNKQCFDKYRRHILRIRNCNLRDILDWNALIMYNKTLQTLW